LEAGLLLRNTPTPVGYCFAIRRLFLFHHIPNLNSIILLHNFDYSWTLFIIDTPPWMAARGEGGMSMDGHSPRKCAYPKKRAGVVGGVHNRTPPAA
jgi:hypothetical protein